MRAQREMQEAIVVMTSSPTGIGGRRTSGSCETMRACGGAACCKQRQIIIAVTDASERLRRP